MTQEALKLALEALEKNTKHLPADFDYHFEAITAIKEALAQTQEPPKYSFKAHWEKDGRIGVVAVVERLDGGFHILEDIIAPPQRTWVGLTDEEIDALHTSIKVRLMGTFDTKDIYRVVEQALKEKNT